jgi:hypothetical protein
VLPSTRALSPALHTRLRPSLRPLGLGFAHGGEDFLGRLGIRDSSAQQQLKEDGALELLDRIGDLVP